MPRPSLNRNLQAARSAKKDEFYTQLSDIEKELKHYKDHFKGKTVLCNCDDPWVSNFFKYFSQNFERLGLKKLITTCYKNQNPGLFSEHNTEKAVWLEYTGDKDGDRVPSPEEIGVKQLKGDGDFRSDECIELLRQSDIVVTNPPFSLFREYITLLAESGKKFLIIGNQNVISSKEVFGLFKANKVWLGYSRPEKFIVPDDYEQREHRSWRDENGTNWRSLGNGCWFTNLDIEKRHEEIILFKQFDPEQYLSYDNFKAIEVSRVAEIPIDYDGVMGVPITFLEKYNPDQFEIVGSDDEVNQGILPEIVRPDWDGKFDRGYVKGRRIYARVLIRNRKPKK